MPTSARPNSQTLKFHSPVSPDPLNASLAQVPKVTPPQKKNPRSANSYRPCVRIAKTRLLRMFIDVIKLLEIFNSQQVHVRFTAKKMRPEPA